MFRDGSIEVWIVQRAQERDEVLLTQLTKTTKTTAKMILRDLPSFAIFAIVRHFIT